MTEKYFIVGYLLLIVVTALIGAMARSNDSKTLYKGCVVVLTLLSLPITLPLLMIGRIAEKCGYKDD